ncbi:MAG: pirin family protein [Rhodospirillaceae bacterium]
MSWHPAPDAACKAAEACDPIELVIQPQDHNLGNFTVRRVLPAPERQTVGPFIFFDQMGPATLAADQPINVRPHPHIGLATLTWLVDGVIMHRDSLGYAQEIQPGAVNWMTAGSGIVHSERSPDRLLGKETSLFGLQVWMALPKEHEEADPSFQHVKAEDIPRIEGEGYTALIVAGEAWGETSPVAVYSPTLYVDLTFEPGATVTIPAEHEERALYLLTGAVEIAGTRFEPGEMLVLKTGLEVPIKALEATHLALIGGAPVDGPRIKWWNFVSSSRERLNQAKADWKEGRFPKVPGDEEEFIPLPEMKVGS